MSREALPWLVITRRLRAVEIVEGYNIAIIRACGLAPRRI